MKAVIEGSGDRETQILRQLFGLKEQLDTKFLSAIRHLTLLDSTVLGIITAFRGEWQCGNAIRWLTIAGSGLLFLSLLLGVYCMIADCITSRKAFRQLLAAYKEGETERCGFAKAPIFYEGSLALCPIAFCLGLLLLLAALWS